MLEKSRGNEMDSSLAPAKLTKLHKHQAETLSNLHLSAVWPVFAGRSG